MKRARLPAILMVASFSVPAWVGSALAAGPDPAAEAERLVATLDVPSTRALVEAPLAKAKAAQARARAARSSGDLRHATQLDALALTWAQVADDLVRTAAAEKKLADLQKQVTDIEQKAVRTQALIEQTIARRGRAEQNLSALETNKPTTKPVKASGKEPALEKPVKGGAKK